jgi:hypothetical protein
MLDTVIGVFTPDCDPDMTPPIRRGSHGLFFGYRELARLCMAHLQEAKGPVRLDEIVDRAIAVKGFEVDARLRQQISRIARATLMRMVKRGMVRRIIEAPDTWWEGGRGSCGRGAPPCRHEGWLWFTKG